MQLLDKQITAIEKLSRYKVGALFMRPGTGKTLPAFELVKSVPNIDYVLWLAPFQTKDNLLNELEKWGGLHCDIVGIETLSASDNVFLDIYNKILNSRKAFIVCDESLKIKNPDAKRTKRILMLSAKAEYKLILNGTPISKNLLDLWAQMQFLSPKILKMSFTQFKNTFCEYIKITKSQSGYTYTREIIKKYHNIDYLHSLIKHYVYEADLELNIHKQYVDIHYSLDDEAKKKYREIKDKYLDDELMELKNNNIFLEMTQKMQHAYSCTPDKFVNLDKIISSHEPDKIVIFTKFIDSQEECKKRYPHIKVLSLQKHSFGLNLQQYNCSIIFDKTWDYALLDQMEHRTFRTGQKEDCIYYNLTANIPLDNIMENCINKKNSMLEYFKQKTIAELKEEL